MSRVLCILAEPLLLVDDLRTQFYTRRGVVKAVDGVSFSINQGEAFGLVGETGCGKSVTGLSIMRLIQSPGRILSGKMVLDGEDLSKKNEEAMRRIRGKDASMIFQDPLTSLNPVFKIGDQIMEAIILHQGLAQKEAREKAIEMLEFVAIPDADSRMNDFPHQLSGGMRQRVMIAMALSCGPKLLIADEPTTNLDVTIQAQIIELLKQIRDRLGSILLISHDLGLIAEVCQRVGIMYAGNIVEIAEIKDLFRNPVHPYTEGLLNCIPRLGHKKKRLGMIPGVVPSVIEPPAGCKFHPRCRYAAEICRRERPFLQEHRGHRASCHITLDN